MRQKDKGGYTCIKACINKQCGKQNDKTMIDFISDHLNILSEENGQVLEGMTESQLCKGMVFN